MKTENKTLQKIAAKIIAEKNRKQSGKELLISTLIFIGLFGATTLFPYPKLIWLVGILAVILVLFWIKVPWKKAKPLSNLEMYEEGKNKLQCLLNQESKIKKEIDELNEALEKRN